MKLVIIIKFQMNDIQNKKLNNIFIIKGLKICLDSYKILNKNK